MSYNATIQLTETAASYIANLTNTTNQPTDLKTLEQMGLHVIRMAKGVDQSDRLTTISEAVRRLKNISYSNVLYLAKGGSETAANHAGNRHIPIQHLSSHLLYGERIGSRPQSTLQVGTNGAVNLYWIDGTTTLSEDWIKNVEIEMINHASNRFGSSHWSLIASLKIDPVNDECRIIDIQPTNLEPSAPTNPIKDGKCICELLRK